MPRYFFHHIDDAVRMDTSGTELPDIETARREAAISLGHAVKDRPEALINRGEARIEVTDETGAVVAAVNIAVS